MRKRKNKPFSYDKEARLRGRKHRLAIYDLDEGLLKAKSGNNEPLAKYLRAGGTITEQRHLDALADLIAPPKRERGRPRGRDTSERAEALRAIVRMVRRLEREWYKKNPNQSLMSRAGVSSDIAELCLGHVITGVRGTYDRNGYHAEKKAGLRDTGGADRPDRQSQR